MNSYSKFKEGDKLLKEIKLQIQKNLAKRGLNVGTDARTRTSTPARALAPEASVSTNSTTPALYFIAIL